MSLCIVPARGGSKRIPRKNVALFHGRPMLAWSIQAALESDCFDRVIVSTDDEEIAAIATREGAEVPFMRPSELSDDLTPTVPVIAHAIGEAEALWGETQLEVCCLYATAPFVRSADIAQARQLLRSTGAEFAMPVTSFPFPIQRGVRLRADARVEMFEAEHASTRSQDLDEAYHDVGQFYWGARSSWLDGKSIMSSDTVALPIPRHRAQDIDTAEDWEFAERLFSAMGKD